MHEVATRSLPTFLALSSLAIAQPLLDLFGRNPEYFVANDASKSQVVGFGVAVVFAVPLLLALGMLVVSLAIPRYTDIAHSAVVAALGAVLGFFILSHLDMRATLPSLVFALACGAGVATAERRWPGVRLGCRYVAVASLAFLGLFLVQSDTSQLLWQDDAEAAVGVEVGAPAPVLVIVFDELPLASLMESTGAINGQRFPNFERLANSSSWFRNATSVSPNTPGSLPSIESGLFPKRSTPPTSADYPRNIFTLLGNSYDLNVTETVSQLCPESLCPRAGESSTGGPAQMASDSLIVLGHQLLPTPFRSRLPDVGQSWGGFGVPGGTESTGANDSDNSLREFMNERVHEMTDARGGAVKGEQMRRIAARAGELAPNDLVFLHDALFPHFNWETTPFGQSYEGDGGPPGAVDNQWGDDEYLIRESMQRHLLQVGYVDALLGELMDAMQESGVWDRALVVVTADHGASFSANTERRLPPDRSTVDEIFRVPLFIKAPSQNRSAVHDENALLVDVLPTIVDMLDIRTDWEFDGRSLIGDSPPHADKPVFCGCDFSAVDTTLGDLLDVVRRNEEWFPRGGGWRGLFAVGQLGGLVGQRVDSLDTVVGPTDRWTVAEATELTNLRLHSFAPVVLHGTLTATGAPAGGEALIAVNGVVAGVAGHFVEAGSRWEFRATVDFRAYRNGSNRLDLLIPLPDGSASQHEILPLGP